MKTRIHTLLLIQMIVAVTALCGQDSLDKARTSKLKQVVTALASTDADTLRTVLSSKHQTISKEAASELLKNVTNSWGDLKILEEINEADLKTTFDKGDMKILAHWGTLPTQYGRWMLFRSLNRKDYYLRIGLLFAKGSDQPGQFVAAESPIQQKTKTHKPDAVDGK